ncbi:uncharacterized protein SAPINGB_P002193 [Magnusiomyces paraingens]|uniref:Uncharacterized protein n=1 Tax=Magnusiomyces paraingens TaxID=2606893 RepID=A0A5E8BEW4_9ASCO|nr:uncharacterized protein SAPINGB_P002193 [Saprochaete ingens]VVT49280.1 unnamed protein product [Saprochaete ingens]
MLTLLRKQAIRASSRVLTRVVSKPTIALASYSHTLFKSPRTFSRNYNPGQQPPPQAFPAPPPQPPPGYAKRTRNRVFFATALLFLTLYAGWKYLTFHRYPPTVADKLRKALFEEYNENYADALKYFLEALQELDRLHEEKMKEIQPQKKGQQPGTLPANIRLDNDFFYISDEYTGLQIRIAQVYEKLSLEEDAINMYREIESVYMHALRANMIPENKRLEIIKRSLGLSLTAAALSTGYPDRVLETSISLAAHFSIAQKELEKLHPELAPLFEEETLRVSIPGTLPSSPESVGVRAESSQAEKDGSTRRVRVKISINVSDTPEAVEARLKAAELWEPFRAELFSARLVFAILSISQKDYPTAIESTFNTTKWMVAAGFPLDDVLTSFFTAGTYLYLQAEEIEMQNWLSEEHKKNEKDPIKLKDFTYDDFKDQFRQELETPFFPKPPPGSVSNESLDNAGIIFQSIMTIINNLPSSVRRKGTIDEIYALAMYSLGVVNLHSGDLDKAQELLREARLRAKGCSFEVLADQADNELATVDDLRKYKESGNKDEYLNGLYNRMGGRHLVMDYRVVPLPDDAPLSLSSLSKS